MGGKLELQERSVFPMITSSDNKYLCVIFFENIRHMHTKFGQVISTFHFDKIYLRQSRLSIKLHQLRLLLFSLFRVERERERVREKVITRKAIDG